MRPRWAPTERTTVTLARSVLAAIAVLLVATVVGCVLNTSGVDPWSGSEAAASAIFSLATFTFPVMGALLAARRPRNAIGWILLAVGFAWGLSGLTEVYLVYALTTHPGALPASPLAVALSAWLWVPGVGLVGTFVLLLFPDGRLPSPRWRWLAWASALALILASVSVVVTPGPLTDSGFPDLVNPLGSDALGFLGIGILLLPVCIVGCALSLVGRFRRSRGQERLQLKWLTAAATVAAVLYLIALLASLPYGWTSAAPLAVRIVQNGSLAAFILFPIAVGIAILRYRLYDIDRLINRAIVNALVSGALAVVYGIGVVGIGALMRAVTGNQRNPLVVAGATLAVAALFRPLRDQTQTEVDRRFYRRRYDAGRTVDSFAQRLRDEIDLKSLNGELLRVVDETMQPARVSLWLARSDTVSR